MNLRDLDQPCEHGSPTPDGRWLCDPYDCPGGREVTIDYEAAQRRYDGIDWSNQSTDPLFVARTIVDAALGGSDE